MRQFNPLMHRFLHCPAACFVLAAAMLLTVAAVADAAKPQISKMPVRGLQIGGTTTVVIQGTDLLPDARLVTGVPIAKQSVLEKATERNLSIEVTLADDVTPGLYNLRLASGKGISTTVIVAVDRLAEKPFAEVTDSLPVALHGSVTGSNIATTELTGKSGQKLLVEVEAQRLGSGLRPVLHLYDAKRRQIAWAMPAPWLAGDARLHCTLPADGTYTLAVHDLQYAGPGPGHFRLKVGALEYADLAFPPAIERGRQASLELIGHITGEKQIVVPARADAGADLLAGPWPSALVSGVRPRVVLSDLTELVEKPAGKEPQTLPPAPVAVSGRLGTPGEEDVYRIEVAEGDKLRLAVQADRIGAPIDPYLEIRNEKGRSLAQNDDSAGTADPELEYTVPKGTKTLDIAIRDQVDRADERSIYRLIVEPQDGPGKPSFSLSVSTDTQNVPQNGTQVFQVVADRHEYRGPIHLSFDNLPSGLTATGTEIPAGAAGTLVTLSGSGEKPQQQVIAIVGKSAGVDPPITATAVFAEHPLGALQPWLAHDVGMAVGEALETPLKIDWEKPLAETPLVLGTTLVAPLKIERPPGAIGPVRLSLFSSEPVPMVNGRPDPKLALRAERETVDIPVDAKAKAAAAALTAAEQAVAAARAKADSTRQAGAKALAAAKATHNAASQQQASAAKVLADAESKQQAAAKTATAATEAKKAAQPAVESAAEDAKAAAEKDLQQADSALAASERALAAANKVLAAAKQQHASAEAALQKAAAQLNAATETAKKNDDAAAAALEVAQKKQLDAEKALRAAEQKIDPQAEFKVIVPPELATSHCDLAIKAELRSLDNRTVLAEVFTPVRRFVPLVPLELQLGGGPKLAANRDDKQNAVLKLTGKVLRKAGFGGDVTVTITGQPGGVAAPKVALKPDEDQFELELKFPPSIKPGPVDSIVLTASGPPDPKQGNIVVKTELPLSIMIPALPAEKK